MKTPSAFCIRIITAASLCVVFPALENRPSMSFQTAKSKPNLADDPRLMAKVTLDGVGASLRELLLSISNASLTLTCGKQAAPLKIQIRVKDRSLKEVMEGLADLLPGSWQSTDRGKSYDLEMDKEFVSKRKRWWRLFLSERECALNEQRASVLSAMRNETRQVETFGDEKLKAQISLEKQFFRALPAHIQEQVASALIDVGYYKLGPLFLANPYVNEGATFVPLSDLPLAIKTNLERQTLLRTGELGGPGASPDALIRFSNTGWQVMLSLVRFDGTWRSLGFHLSVGHGPANPALMLDHAGLAVEVRRFGSQAPTRWIQLAQFHNGRFFDARTTAASARRVSKPTRRADVLGWLAAKGDIEYISDYYSSPCRIMRDEEKAQPLTRTVEAELAFRAAENDSNWKKRGQLYLVRNNRWYRDDLLEVPNELAKTLLSSLRKVDEARSRRSEIAPGIDRAYRLQMDFQASVVTSLSPWQIANGLSWFVIEERVPPDATGKIYRWCPFALEGDRILRELQTTRFYSQLNDAQRSELIAGRLSCGALDGPIFKLAAALVPEIRFRAADSGLSALRLGLASQMPPGAILFAPLGPNSLALSPESRLMLMTPVH